MCKSNEFVMLMCVSSDGHVSLAFSTHMFLNISSFTQLPLSFPEALD